MSSRKKRLNVRFGALRRCILTGRISTMAEDLQALRKTLGNCALAQYVARFDWQNRNMNEQFRTVAEVAEMLGVSKDTVRRLFANEPGVIDLGRREATRGKRRYRVLRIPSNVINRVLNNRSVK
jgi:hypothetical protein